MKAEPADFKDADFKDLDKLLYRWCEGDISVEEGQRLELLLHEPAARKYFLDYVQLDAHLGWELDEEAGVWKTPCRSSAWDRRWRPVHRRRRMLVGTGLAAALAGAIVAGFLVWRPQVGREGVLPAVPEQAVATVESLTGSVKIVGSDGAARPCVAGDAVRPGESIDTGAEEGSAEVVYDRGARIELGPETKLLFPDESEAGDGANLVQICGTLALEVARQAPDRPLVLKTPHGLIRVVGTQFRSLVGTEATRVETEEGCVEVTRASDQQRAKIDEGDYLVVGPSREPLAVRAAPITLTEANRVLEDRKNQESIWRTDNARPVAELVLGAPTLLCLALSPDGRTLAAGDQDGNVVICDARERRKQETFRAHDRAVLSMAISPDGRWLATGGRDALVKLWDTAGWKLQATLRGHVRDVVSLAFCPDRQLLATSDNTGITRVWDVRTGSEAVVISWPRFREARTVFTPDGRTVVTAGTRSAIKFWDVPEEVRESSPEWPIQGKR